MSTMVLTVKGRASRSQTFVDAAVATGTEIITLPGHALVDGDIVRFTNSGGALPTGLTSRKHYYVVSAVAGASIKVSETSGGSAVNITAAAGGGTHTIRLVETPYDRRLLRDATAPKEAVVELRNWCDRVLAGNESASIDAQTDPEDPVAASMTYTLASVVADEAVTIGGVVLTAKASPSGEAQWASGGADDTADAVTLAAAINKHSTLSKIVTASAAAAVVTVTCKVKGFIGNFITTTETGTTITASAATLTGGTGGATSTAKTYAMI